MARPLTKVGRYGVEEDVPAIPKHAVRTLEPHQLRDDGRQESDANRGQKTTDCPEQAIQEDRNNPKRNAGGEGEGGGGEFEAQGGSWFYLLVIRFQRMFVLLIVFSSFFFFHLVFHMTGDYKKSRLGANKSVKNCNNQFVSRINHLINSLIKSTN